MQNNIVYNTEEEALRNTGLYGGINADINTGLIQGLNTGVPQQIQGQYYQQGAIGGILGNELSTGTIITETQYVTNTQYATDPQLLAGQPLIGGGVPLVGANIANTGFTGVPIVTGQGALGAGALSGVVVGANALGYQQQQGVRTTGLVPNTAFNGSGLGTFVFRPLEAKFLKDKDVVGKMDPYCKIKIGFHSGKSSVAKSAGTNPVWNDVISLNRKHSEQFAKLKIKDKDRKSLNDKLGEVKIPLTEVAIQGRVKQWFNVYKKEQLAGEILLDIEFQPRTVF